MPRSVFVPGKPVETDTPEVEVPSGLAPGTHTFELVVIDADGLESDPVRKSVNVYLLIPPRPGPGPIPRPGPG